jgi:hypothetical protein
VAAVLILAISAICSVSAGGAQGGAAGSLSGVWLFGDDAPEPTQAVVSIPQRCWSGGVDFTLAESGNKLTGTARWSEPAGGVARNSARDESETLTGTREGDHVVLRGHHVVVTTGLAYPSVPDGSQESAKTIIKYDLRLDPKTGHLVGTRAGRPFWLARFKMRHADCGGSPPP